MLGKSWEFWAVLLGMAFYVAARDAEKEAPVKRIAKTAASALLAYGLADGVAGYVGGSPTFAAVLIMGFGLIILDVGTALLLDRDLIKELVLKKFGGGDKT